MSGVPDGSAATVVWIDRGASSFSCLCETCLDRGQAAAASFPDLVGRANVRGTLSLEADVGLLRCPSGHRVIVRRTTQARRRARGGARELMLPTPAVR